MAELELSVEQCLANVGILLNEGESDQALTAFTLLKVFLSAAAAKNPSLIKKHT